MSTLARPPLLRYHTYRDRSKRRWHVIQLCNAGRFHGVPMPAMALATCLDASGDMNGLRLAQWFFADSWRFTASGPDHPFDLQEAA